MLLLSVAGGQILLVTAGEGWYQEWNKESRKLKERYIVNIPANVKRWQDDEKDSALQHLAIEVPAEEGRTEWCKAYNSLS